MSMGLGGTSYLLSLSMIDKTLWLNVIGFVTIEPKLFGRSIILITKPDRKTARERTHGLLVNGRMMQSVRPALVQRPN